MDKTQGLMRRDLMRLTGALPHEIAYLRDYGRLPIIRPSEGVGDPVIYSQEAVQVLRLHLARKRRRHGLQSADR